MPRGSVAWTARRCGTGCTASMNGAQKGSRTAGRKATGRASRRSSWRSSPRSLKPARSAPCMESCAGAGWTCSRSWPSASASLTTSARSARSSSSSASRTSAAQVRHAKPGRHGDGRGLYLQVIGGSRTWVLRYEHGKRERWMGLGSAEFVTLAQARERAFELRRQLKDQGIDPLERRRAAVVGARLTALKRGTFEEVASQYVEVKSSQWKGDGSRREWLSTLQRYAFPIIGSFSVASIDTALVRRVLEPVWAKKNHVGQRLRERIEAVLEFAKSMGLRDGENPARWKGHLANVLPKASRTGRTKHHPALPFNQMPEFMAELRALPGIAARALEFTILTAT